MQVREMAIFYNLFYNNRKRHLIFGLYMAVLKPALVSFHPPEITILLFIAPLMPKMSGDNNILIKTI